MPDQPAMPPLPSGYMALLRYEEGPPHYRLWHFLKVSRDHWSRVGASVTYNMEQMRIVASRGTIEVVHPGFAWREPYGPTEVPSDAPIVGYAGGYATGVTSTRGATRTPLSVAEMAAIELQLLDRERRRDATLARQGVNPMTRWSVIDSRLARPETPVGANSEGPTIEYYTASGDALRDSYSVTRSTISARQQGLRDWEARVIEQYEGNG